MPGDGYRHGKRTVVGTPQEPFRIGWKGSIGIFFGAMLLVIAFRWSVACVQAWRASNLSPAELAAKYKLRPDDYTLLLAFKLEGTGDIVRGGYCDEEIACAIASWRRQWDRMTARERARIELLCKHYPSSQPFVMFCCLSMWRDPQAASLHYHRQLGESWVGIGTMCDMGSRKLEAILADKPR